MNYNVNEYILYVSPNQLFLHVVLPVRPDSTTNLETLRLAKLAFTAPPSRWVCNTRILHLNVVSAAKNLEHKKQHVF
jgi:hypothetical protein